MATAAIIGTAAAASAISGAVSTAGSIAGNAISQNRDFSLQKDMMTFQEGRLSANGLPPGALYAKQVPQFNHLAGRNFERTIMPTSALRTDVPSSVMMGLTSIQNNRRNYQDQVRNRNDSASTTPESAPPPPAYRRADDPQLPFNNEMFRSRMMPQGTMATLVTPGGANSSASSTVEHTPESWMRDNTERGDIRSPNWRKM